MRNSFLYYGFNKEDLLKALLNISDNMQYISVLVSNINQKETSLPKDYIRYDLIAGVGEKDILISDTNSFNNLSKFHAKKKDWLFGYLSYDLKNEIENLVSKNIDNFAANNLSFFVPKFVLLLKNDILEIQTYQSKEYCDRFVKSFDFSNLPICNFDVNFKRRDDKKSYLKKIEKIKSHIKRGDIYEMNYCQEFYASGVRILPESVFLELNSRMRTPFSSFLKLKDKYILSASPERFLRKKGNYILAQPIKGTRKRGCTDSEDNILINKLIKSEKDISENIMITDLVRNDLSITASKGTVKVEELCKVYTFKEVHQMITSVISEVDSVYNFTDVLKAAFPMGSMTGAPKLKAMELIDYFEDFKRGFFSGSVGYITPQADFDFNVVIRTILYDLVNHYLSIGVGGAITIRSDSFEEYEECLIKAKPLFDVFNFKIDD